MRAYFEVVQVLRKMRQSLFLDLLADLSTSPDFPLFLRVLSLSLAVSFVFCLSDW